jgi:hypothetical protein
MTKRVGAGFQEAAVLFHFTDTARLPWILETGELRPGSTRFPGQPPDFLWATTDERGDRTATLSRDAWRRGDTQLVRFTLARGDFEPWRAVVDRFPEWTEQVTGSLERAAERARSNPDAWWCRVDPLPLSRVLKIQSKAWSSSWQQFSPTVSRHPVDASTRFVVIGNRRYYSTRRENAEHGRSAYSVSSTTAAGGEA